MNRSVMAFRVGLFTLLGIALIGVAFVLASGGRWFAPKQRVVMHFDGSVFGLPLGAPVVFRGVRLGRVVSVGLAGASAPGAIAVSADLDQDLLRELQGQAADLNALLARGLSARLATQSLLTGQLYVDLDLRGAPSSGAAAAAAPGGPLQIPTTQTQMQALQAQLEGLDLAQIGRDVGAVATSARQLLAGPQPARALASVADAAGALEKLAQRLDQRMRPLADAAQGTLADARTAMQQLGGAAQRASAAASQVETLAASGAPLVGRVQQLADELSRTAAALREASSEDSSLRVNADRALQDVSRAARALREVGELLERNPDALLRGRAAAP